MHQLEKNIHFLGFINHTKLPQYMASANICVIPSLKEGFGLTCIEAMACGTLVVSSNIPSLSETIIDTKTGFLVDPHRPDKITQKICNILRNKYNFSIIKENARSFVCENYTWQNIAMKYKHIIIKL